MSALHHLLDDADILVTSVSYFHFREVYRISMQCHFPRFVVTREMNSKWYLCLPPETILEFVPSRVSVDNCHVYKRESFHFHFVQQSYLWCCVP